MEQRSTQVLFFWWAKLSSEGDVFVTGCISNLYLAPS